MSRTETGNAALWNALDTDAKRSFVEHAWRMAEYYDREHPPGQDHATQPYMDALKDYCEVRTGDTGISNIVSAADTFKHVPQHAGSLYDTLPENIRRANAIFHAANAEAKHYLLPSDVFLMQDPDHARRTEAGTSLMDVKESLRIFTAAHGPESRHKVATLAAANAASHLAEALEEMVKLTQPGPPVLSLEKLDRRLLAGYCNTLQTPEIAAQHPELQAPVAALVDLLELQDVQQQVKAEKSTKAFYSR